MNFLAHIYLSGNDHEIMIGNFIGDFVKGSSYREYPEKIQKGILLHREIDRFTDENEVVVKSKEKLRPTYHHYAPVIVDVFYDHFLAVLWQDFHPVPLETFTNTFFRIADTFEETLPENARRMYYYMKRDNWLVSYRDLEGINKALTGMAQRTSFESSMEKATDDLKAEYPSFQSEFLTFFPQLKAHSQRHLLSLNQ